MQFRSWGNARERAARMYTWLLDGWQASTAVDAKFLSCFDNPELGVGKVNERFNNYFRRRKRNPYFVEKGRSDTFNLHELQKGFGKMLLPNIDHFLSSKFVGGVYGNVIMPSAERCSLATYALGIKGAVLFHFWF
ncbi:hypothetical protein AAMO2058_000194600 [Amorphochlora amoebiformis]